jgi:hypothetical protein
MMVSACLCVQGALTAFLFMYTYFQQKEGRSVTFQNELPATFWRVKSKSAQNFGRFCTALKTDALSNSSSP